MFTNQNRMNKTIFYFFTILVLISVIFIWGFSLPNVLNADDKPKDKVEEKEDKEDKDKEDKDKEDKDKEDKDKEDKDKEDKEDKDKEDKDKEDKDKEDKDKEDKDSKTFHITASSNNGGFISPKGHQDVDSGESISFNCVEDEGYELIYIRVDNIKIEGITSYTFNSVDSNHTIHARFKKVKDTADSSGDEDPENNLLDDYNGNMIAFCGTFFIFYKDNSLKIKEKNSNNIKTKKIVKSYDKKYLFDIIKINDTDQLLDIDEITKKNQITEIIDVDDIINEGNYIEIGQLDLNTDNPFISAFIFVWGKIKDFSYYYNT